MVCVSDREIFPLVISLAEFMQLKRRDNIQHRRLTPDLQRFNSVGSSQAESRRYGQNMGYDSCLVDPGSVQIARNDADRIRLY